MNEEKIKKLEEQIQEIKIEKVILEDQLKTEKIKLEGQLNTLRKEIREKETVILIQGKVIKLLDDSDQTLQKSIVAQIEAQNITMDAFPPNP